MDESSGATDCHSIKPSDVLEISGEKWLFPHHWEQPVHARNEDFGKDWTQGKNFFVQKNVSIRGLLSKLVQLKNIGRGIQEAKPP